MNIKNKLKVYNFRIILIGILIFLFAGLNFYLLNKVIGSSKTSRNFEKNIRI